MNLLETAIQRWPKRIRWVPLFLQMLGTMLLLIIYDGVDGKTVFLSKTETVFVLVLILLLLYLSVFGAHAMQYGVAKNRSFFHRFVLYHLWGFLVGLCIGLAAYIAMIFLTLF